MMFPSSPLVSHAGKNDKADRTIKIFVFCLLFFSVFFWFFPASSQAASSVKDLYMVGEKKYQELRKDPRKQKLRSHWEETAKAFEKAHARDPKDAWASAALYRAADTYLGLSKVSGRKSDKDRAISLFKKVERSYPKSFYKIQAGERLKELHVASQTKTPPPQTTLPAATIKTVQTQTEKPSAATNVQVRPSPGISNSQPNTIQGLRYKTHPGHTRIVVDTEQESAYSYNDLKLDRKAGLPQRIYVDFQNAKLNSAVGSIEIKDPQVSQIRIAQNTPDKVRLVIDIEKTENFNIFQLFDPNRTVIDVMSTASASDQKTLAASLPTSVRQPPQTPAASKEPHYKVEIKTPSTGAIRKQLALGVNRIVIDPGHGGSDPGAIGHKKGVLEKDVNLQIAKKLAENLRKRLGCEVFLTRDKDVHLTLESRTQFANNKKADLFISLHTNSSPSSKAHGIETYFLNLATDDEAIAVAARENATSTKNISDLQTILNDLMQNAKINESSKLASYVQRGVMTTLKPHYTPLNDKGVKQAPFYVLLGAQMPSILIETGFINNQRDCQRLIHARYQNLVVTGITQGVEAYIKDYMQPR